MRARLPRGMSGRMRRIVIAMRTRSNAALPPHAWPRTGALEYLRSRTMCPHEGHRASAVSLPRSHHTVCALHAGHVGVSARGGVDGLIYQASLGTADTAEGRRERFSGCACAELDSRVEICVTAKREAVHGRRAPEAATRSGESATATASGPTKLHARERQLRRLAEGGRITRGASRTTAPLAGSDLRSTVCAKTIAGMSRTPRTEARARLLARRMNDVTATSRCEVAHRAVRRPGHAS